MNKQTDELDPRLADFLNEMQTIPARDPQMAARTRSKFLNQAVSLSEERRHSNKWKLFLPRMVRFSANLITSTLMLAGLLVGVTYAAQDDLPNQPLYQVKLATERARLWFSDDPATDVEILMEVAQTRTAEVVALSEQGVVPDNALVVQAQENIQQSVQIAASLDMGARANTLQKIHSQLIAQQRLVNEAREETCKQCGSVIQETNEMLQAQLGRVESDMLMTRPPDPPDDPPQDEGLSVTAEPAEETAEEPTEAPAPEPTEEPTLDQAQDGGQGQYQQAEEDDRDGKGANQVESEPKATKVPAETEAPGMSSTEVPVTEEPVITPPELPTPEPISTPDVTPLDGSGTGSEVQSAP